MTDRLATLMHGEIDSLEIPAPPAIEILDAGRRLHRRRTWARRGGAAVLSVAVLAAGAVALQGGRGSDSSPPATPTPPHLMAYAVDDTVHLGDGTAVKLPEVAQSLYYTSAGVLVRTNKDGSSDGGAPFHLELVTPDGTATKLSVTLGDVVPSTDPSEPYLAWATMADGKIQVVVHDVRTDQDVATVDVPGTFDWGGWEAPPVALSGSDVYVGTNDSTEVVDWKTGESSTNEVAPASTLPEVKGGHLLHRGTTDTEVVDARSGQVVLDIPGTAEDGVDLSPDGRFAIVRAGDRSTIYDVDTGAEVQVPASDWGWSSDSSDVFRVEGSTLTTCSTTTGRCQDTSAPSVGTNASVRYAGQLIES